LIVTRTGKYIQLKFCSSVFQIVFCRTSEFCELKVRTAVIIIIIIITIIINLNYFSLYLTVMHPFN